MTKQKEAKLLAHSLMMKYGVEGATDLAIWQLQQDEIDTDIDLELWRLAYADLEAREVAR